MYEVSWGRESYDSDPHIAEQRILTLKKGSSNSGFVYIFLNTAKLIGEDKLKMISFVFVSVK